VLQEFDGDYQHAIQLSCTKTCQHCLGGKYMNYTANITENKNKLVQSNWYACQAIDTSFLKKFMDTSEALIL
jgi:23S rRNA A1618 N6-methylase RlmF